VTITTGTVAREIKDLAVTAIRDALEAALHDLTEILVIRVDPQHVSLSYNPDGDDWRAEREMVCAYTATLRAAGWHPLDLGVMVLVTAPADAAPGSYTATWTIDIEGADSVQAAAEDARKYQIDPGVSESGWIITNHLGQAETVNVRDRDRDRS